jgi:hypothetical protein
MAKPQFSKTFDRVLAGLKYHVEPGEKIDSPGSVKLPLESVLEAP